MDLYLVEPEVVMDLYLVGLEAVMDPYLIGTIVFYVVLIVYSCKDRG